MATLLNLQNGEKTNLLAYHIIGRHPSSSSLVLDNPKASRTHASITWDGEHWLLQDTSTNGTYVNGIRIAHKTEQVINQGDKLHFVSPNAEGWQLLDSEPPKSMLLPQTPGAGVIVLEQIAVLPSEASPEVTLYLSPEGRWYCESHLGTNILANGDKVGTKECIWRFAEAANCVETLRIEVQTTASSSQIEACFSVSQNEEHVSLQLKINQLDFDLGERNHHYLLLLLARKWMADKAAGFADTEQGWMEKDELGQMLGLSETHLNMLIYRFRKQMIKVSSDNLILPQMVQRRKGELRFVCGKVLIEGGTKM